MSERVGCAWCGWFPPDDDVLFHNCPESENRIKKIMAIEAEHLKEIDEALAALPPPDEWDKHFDDSGPIAY